MGDEGEDRRRERARRVLGLGGPGRASAWDAASVGGEVGGAGVVLGLLAGAVARLWGRARRRKR